MPTYDYLCESCGKRFDVWQKMSDEPVTVCPDCAGHVHRVIHATSIVFKGAGFYSTDHRGASTVATSAGETATASTPAAASAPESAPATSTNGAASGTPAPAPATTSPAKKAAS